MAKRQKKQAPKLPKRLKPAYTEPPSNESSTRITNLPVDTLTHILSFVLDFSSVGTHTAKNYNSVSRVCTVFKKPLAILLEDAIRQWTEGHWSQLPFSLACLFDDAMRLKINGVTQSTALALMVPPDVLHTLPFSVQRLSRYCTAYVYSAHKVIGALSQLFPTIDMYQTARETRDAKSAALIAARQANAQKRDARKKEISDVLDSERVTTFHRPDPKLVKLYVTNGSPKNLAKIREAARQARFFQDRKDEVKTLLKSMRASFFRVPANILDPYLHSGDKGQPWQDIISSIQTAVVRDDRNKKLDKLLKDCTLPKDLIDPVTRTNYINTGAEDVWENINQQVVQATQNRKDRETRLQNLLGLVYNLAGEKEWIRGVPVNVWLTDSVISEYVKTGAGNIEEACSTLVATLTTHQFSSFTHTDTTPSPRLMGHLFTMRRHGLIKELSAHGLGLRSDSKFCEQFIAGKTTASIEEVVAIMMLSCYLFQQGGHRCWSSNHSHMEQAMRKRMKNMEYDSWYAAYESVKSLMVIEYYDDDYDYY